MDARWTVAECSLRAAQVPVMISTPTHVLDEVAKRLDAFLRANRAEYTGARECVYRDVQDVFPVRTIIFIAFQYTHSSEQHRHLHLTSAAQSEPFTALHLTSRSA